MDVRDISIISTNLAYEGRVADLRFEWSWFESEKAISVLDKKDTYRSSVLGRNETVSGGEHDFTIKEFGRRLIKGMVH